MIRRHAPYSRYAEVYDLIGQRIFGERIAAATLDWLTERDISPERALDLACGTGAATLVLADAGLEVVGVDRSTEMLDAARSAAVNRQLKARWIEQDIRELTLDDRFDLAVSYFDSVNYLVEDGDLARVFSGVRNVLADNGHFVFDLNTRRRLAEHWGDTCIVAADRDDVFGIYRSWFEAAEDLSPLLLTFFVRSPENPGLWERFDEEHVERAYDLDEVTGLLEDNGFDVVERRAFLDGPGVLGGTGDESSERVVFFAQKRPDDQPAEATSPC